MLVRRCRVPEDVIMFQYLAPYETTRRYDQRQTISYNGFGRRGFLPWLNTSLGKEMVDFRMNHDFNNVYMTYLSFHIEAVCI